MTRTIWSGILAVTSVVVAVAPVPAGADLGAALRKSTASAPAALPAAAPLSGSVVIPLQRVSARAHGGASESASFYVGEAAVGHPPQKLRVLFDTASGHVILPHRVCNSLACQEHHRYSPWESSTAMSINLNGSQVQVGHRLAQNHVRRDGFVVGYTQADLGDGDTESVLVRDRVCVGSSPGGEACVDLAVLAATKMDDKPFRAMPNDGIVGLGLAGLAAGPICSFIGRMLEGSTNIVSQFGIAFGASQGEIHFGGHDLARLAAPLHWFPVDHPEDGYWQVAIQAVRVGNVTVDSCSRGCHGIVDTGASRLGVQASHLAKLTDALAAALSSDEGCWGPDLTFDLGGMLLTLGPSEYAGADCGLQLGSLDVKEPEFNGVYAFGEAVLRRYYAAFDWEQRKLGFAPLAGEDKPGATTSGSSIQGLPSEMAGVILV